MVGDVAPAAAAPDWRRVVAPYVGPDDRRGAQLLAVTLVLLVASMGATIALLAWSWLAALALAPLTAGLLVRTFIFMHDCAHGSLFSSRRANDTVGFVTGALTFTPFDQWRRDHALHHASSGDLDRRGHGDIPTLTVREYLARPWRGRLAYRLVRHPAALLLVGPFHLVLNQRFRGRSVATRSRQISSVWGTNAAIAALLALGFWLLGWQAVVIAYLVPYYLAAMAGIWLFYVQHQFEDAYWAPHQGWDYADAALQGSSHLVLPPILRWFTGNIGLHHVHHVAPRIPNYRLQECHDQNEVFHMSPTVTPLSGIAALRLALWDEDRQRLVAFRDVSTN